MRRSRSSASNSTPVNKSAKTTTTLAPPITQPTTSITPAAKKFTFNEPNSMSSNTAEREAQHSTTTKNVEQQLHVPLASAEDNTSTRQQVLDPPPQDTARSSTGSCLRQICDCQIDMEKESLNYNYRAAERYQSLKDSGKLKSEDHPPPLPRIRNRGEYYVDTFNDAPMTCSFGTNEEAGTWMNSGDQAGSIMAALVWLLMLYSIGTISLLAETGGIPPLFAMIYCYLQTMALACHAKTSFTDPGSVPRSSVPVEVQRQFQTSHSMCGQCQTFKPLMSHHCRICNRCVSKMDHHCPWMNNCVGAANLKHFTLFLIYTWTSSAFALCVFGWNYFMCADESCTFNPVLIHLVRVMTVLAVGAFLFTSSMLMNVCYGLMTGIGTIDRLKKKATNTMSQSDEEPIPLKDVFGIAGYYTWPFPMDPIFDDYDRLMGYSSPQRLLREQQLMEQEQQEKKNGGSSSEVEMTSYCGIVRKNDICVL